MTVTRTVLFHMLSSGCFSSHGVRSPLPACIAQRGVVSRTGYAPSGAKLLSVPCYWRKEKNSWLYLGPSSFFPLLPIQLDTHNS